jgi:CubicO group peptidase (beta-lactamase class C family)
MGIASMSKQFLGMAILILEQDGKLKLDENIGMYFPDLPIADRKISIKQLLSHTSGLPELTQNEEFMSKIDQPHTVNQIIELAFKSEFRSEVGEKFMYCNTGYTIAVALIEKLSGMKYADFLKRNIFEPLNMKNTCSCDYQQDATLAVQRYEPDSLSFKKAIDMHFSNLIGGGAIISNVQDMAKWCMALLSGKNLPENYQKLWEPVLLNSGESTEYGLGLGISDYEGIKFYYHPGMGSGMNSIDLIFPDQNISISVIRNISTPKVPSKDIALLAAKYLLTKNQH